MSGVCPGNRSGEVQTQVFTRPLNMQAAQREQEERDQRAQAGQRHADDRMVAQPSPLLFGKGIKEFIWR